jgi:V8-like Glu-specific endopeptidase
MGKLRTSLAVCCLALVGALAAAPGAQGASEASIPRAGEVSRTAGEVVDYWTPKRMRNAKPVAMAVPPDEPEDRQLVPLAAPLIAFELTDTTSFPNRVHGKVFFTKPGGSNFVCSGTVILAPNDATVVTAGHCVADNGLFATNLAFVPGYRNGTAPFGVWAASALATTSQWLLSESFKYDVGAAVMARNSKGQELEDVVGGRGILFGEPVSGSVRAYGYPAQSPFDGLKLWACDATLGVIDSNPTLGPGPEPMAITCDMNGGSSGGGWVKTDTSGDGFVISVNSYKYSGQPTTMYGPQFGGVVETLYGSVESVAPGTPLSPAAGGAPQQPIAQPATTGALKQAKCKKSKKRKGNKKKRCKKIRR